MTQRGESVRRRKRQHVSESRANFATQCHISRSLYPLPWTASVAQGLRYTRLRHVCTVRGTWAAAQIWDWNQERP